MVEDKYSLWFNRIGGTLIFIFGLAIEIKNFFYTDFNGYEIIFGIEFITAGICLIYGKFKGFKK
ncbi:MAG TPA: hypothetical protein VJB89_04260 [Candidatus Nanoarchaeia archaeon]|nr:hypothetical protein [Candidatus Nanoarchaeia archaeon]